MEIKEAKEILEKDLAERQQKAMKEINEILEKYKLNMYPEAILRISPK